MSNLIPFSNNKIEIKIWIINLVKGDKLFKSSKKPKKNTPSEHNNIVIIIEELEKILFRDK